MNKRKFFSGLILFIIPIIVFTILIINIDQATSETPCVDGKNRVNLEGFMCEQVETYIFGFHSDLLSEMLLIFTLLSFVFIILGIGLMVLGVIEK